MDDTERDRRFAEAGEPPWGDVLPGTTSVTYWRPEPPAPDVPLIRMVAEVDGGPFYVESYRGHGRWVLDSQAFGLLGHRPEDPPRSLPVEPRRAAEIMREIDSRNQR